MGVGAWGSGPMQKARQKSLASACCPCATCFGRKRIGRTYRGWGTRCSKKNTVSVCAHSRRPMPHLHAFTPLPRPAPPPYPENTPRACSDPTHALPHPPPTRGGQERARLRHALQRHGAVSQPLRRDAVHQDVHLVPPLCWPGGGGERLARTPRPPEYAPRNPALRARRKGGGVEGWSRYGAG